MTTYPHDAPEPDGCGCLLGLVVMALVSALTWGGIVWLLRWLV